MLWIVPRSSLGGNNRCRVSMAAVRFFFSPMVSRCRCSLNVVRADSDDGVLGRRRLFEPAADPGRLSPLQLLVECYLAVGVCGCWAEVVKGSLISAVVNARGCVGCERQTCFVATSGTSSFLSRIAKMLTEVALFLNTVRINVDRKFPLWPFV